MEVEDVIEGQIKQTNLWVEVESEEMVLLIMQIVQQLMASIILVVEVVVLVQEADSSMVEMAVQASASLDIIRKYKP